MGLEVEHSAHSNLCQMLNDRGMTAFPTFGVHDIVCRLPTFSSLEELRKIIDSVLFITESGKALVANVTTYIILDLVEKKSQNRTTAFCFIRAERIPSKDMFRRMIKGLYDVESVLSVSTVVGVFDLICEVYTVNLQDLERTVNRILSTPGVSSRAITVCMVLRAGKSEERRDAVS